MAKCWDLSLRLSECRTHSLQNLLPTHHTNCWAPPVNKLERSKHSGKKQKMGYHLMGKKAKRREYYLHVLYPRHFCQRIFLSHQYLLGPCIYLQFQFYVIQHGLLGEIIFKWWPLKSDHHHLITSSKSL